MMDGSSRGGDQPGKRAKLLQQELTQDQQTVTHEEVVKILNYEIDRNTGKESHFESGKMKIDISADLRVPKGANVSLKSLAIEQVGEGDQFVVDNDLTLTLLLAPWLEPDCLNPHVKTPKFNHPVYFDETYNPMNACYMTNGKNLASQIYGGSGDTFTPFTTGYLGFSSSIRSYGKQIPKMVHFTCFNSMGDMKLIKSRADNYLMQTASFQPEKGDGKIWNFDEMDNIAYTIGHATPYTLAGGMIGWTENTIDFDVCCMIPTPRYKDTKRTIFDGEISFDIWNPLPGPTAPYNWSNQRPLKGFDLNEEQFVSDLANCEIGDFGHKKNKMVYATRILAPGGGVAIDTYDNNGTLLMTARRVTIQIPKGTYVPSDFADLFNRLLYEESTNVEGYGKYDGTRIGVGQFVDDEIMCYAGNAGRVYHTEYPIDNDYYSGPDNATKSMSFGDNHHLFVFGDPDDVTSTIPKQVCHMVQEYYPDDELLGHPRLNFRNGSSFEFGTGATYTPSSDGVNFGIDVMGKGRVAFIGIRGTCQGAMAHVGIGIVAKAERNEVVYSSSNQASRQCVSEFMDYWSPACLSSAWTMTYEPINLDDSSMEFPVVCPRSLRQMCEDENVVDLSVSGQYDLPRKFLMDMNPYKATYTSALPEGWLNFVKAGTPPTQGYSQSNPVRLFEKIWPIFPMPDPDSGNVFGGEVALVFDTDEGRFGFDLLHNPLTIEDMTFSNTVAYPKRSVGLSQYFHNSEMVNRSTPINQIPSLHMQCALGVSPSLYYTDLTIRQKYDETGKPQAVNTSQGYNAPIYDGVDPGTSVVVMNGKSQEGMYGEPIGEYSGTLILGCTSSNESERQDLVSFFSKMGFDTFSDKCIFEVPELDTFNDSSYKSVQSPLVIDSSETARYHTHQFGTKIKKPHALVENNVVVRVKCDYLVSCMDRLSHTRSDDVEASINPKDAEFAAETIYDVSTGTYMSGSNVYPESDVYPYRKQDPFMVGVATFWRQSICFGGMPLQTSVPVGSASGSYLSRSQHNLYVKNIGYYNATPPPGQYTNWDAWSPSHWQVSNYNVYGGMPVQSTKFTTEGGTPARLKTYTGLMEQTCENLVAANIGVMKERAEANNTYRVRLKDALQNMINVGGVGDHIRSVNYVGEMYVRDDGVRLPDRRSEPLQRNCDWLAATGTFIDSVTSDTRSFYIVQDTPRFKFSGMFQYDPYVAPGAGNKYAEYPPLAQNAGNWERVTSTTHLPYYQTSGGALPPTWDTNCPVPHKFPYDGHFYQLTSRFDSFLENRRILYPRQIMLELVATVLGNKRAGSCVLQNMYNYETSLDSSFSTDNAFVLSSSRTGPISRRSVLQTNSAPYLAENLPRLGFGTSFNLVGDLFGLSSTRFFTPYIIPSGERVYYIWHTYIPQYSGNNMIVDASGGKTIVTDRDCVISGGEFFMVPSDGSRSSLLESKRQVMELSITYQQTFSTSK